MPAILRWFTWMCFGFALFLPLSLIPYGSHRINEVEVTFAEFWRRGGGPLFFIAGIVFPILGYGFVRARNWARYGFTAVQVVLALITLLLSNAWWETACAVGFAVFAGYYLFYVPAARDYFDNASDNGI